MRGRHISGERVSRSFPRFLQVYTSHKRFKVSAQRRQGKVPRSGTREIQSHGGRQMDRNNSEARQPLISMLTEHKMCSGGGAEVHSHGAVCRISTPHPGFRIQVCDEGKTAITVKSLHMSRQVVNFRRHECAFHQCRAACPPSPVTDGPSAPPSPTSSPFSSQ